MTSHVRRATTGDASAVAEVVQSGFKEYVAPDWDNSARRSFLRETTAEKLEAVIAQATLVAVFEEEGRILGVIAMPRPTLVQLLFVAPGYMRRGIARALWEAARTHLAESHPETRTVELNSSPYAVDAYKALGFFPISQPFRRKGAVATRMACWLPGRARETGPNARQRQDGMRPPGTAPSTRQGAAPGSVDQYVQAFPPEIQSVLQAVRRTVLESVPGGEERISYRMPAVFKDGVVVYYAAFKNHLGLYPPVADPDVRAKVAPYAGPKGNLQFPYSEPIPYELIAEVAVARLKANQAKVSAARRSRPRT